MFIANENLRRHELLEWNQFPCDHKFLKAITGTDMDTCLTNPILECIALVSYFFLFWSRIAITKELLSSTFFFSGDFPFYSISPLPWKCALLLKVSVSYSKFILFTLFRKYCTCLVTILHLFKLMGILLAGLPSWFWIDWQQADRYYKIKPNKKSLKEICEVTPSCSELLYSLDYLGL